MVFPELISEKVDFEKNQQTTKSLQNYPVGKDTNVWVNCLVLFSDTLIGCKSKRPLVKTLPSQNVPELVKTSP